MPNHCQIRITKTLALRDSCNEAAAHPILGACLKLQQVNVLREMPLAYGVNGKKSVCCTLGSSGNRGFINAFLDAEQSVIQNPGERQLNKLICSKIRVRDRKIPHLAPLRQVTRKDAPYTLWSRFEEKFANLREPASLGNANAVKSNIGVREHETDQRVTEHLQGFLDRPLLSQ